jgi:hypothetical protein
VALAVPLIIVMAHSSSPSDPLLAIAAGASAAPNAAAATDAGKRPKSDRAGKGNNGNKGNKGIGAPGRGPITIRSIAGSALSLGTEDGWTRTIIATSSTVITKGGQTIAVSDLQVGDEIRFSQTRNTDGTYTIDAIVVPTPTAGGEVTAVDASTITVKGKGGTTRVITVNGSTVYRLGSASGTKADVNVGLRVDAQGTLSGDTFTAITVRIKLPEVGGVVTAKTSDSITVKHGDGSTTVLHVTANTTYEYKGRAAATLADITVGDRVNAHGTLRADGSMDAVSVEGRAPKTPRTPKPANPAASAPG